MNSQRKPPSQQKPILALSAFASLAALLQLFAPACAAQRQKQGGFPAEARHIVSLVAKSGGDALRRFASRNGILVVRRMADWKRTEQPLREASASSGPHGTDYLYLGGCDKFVWVETEVEFSRSDLTSPGFRGIGAQAQHWVHTTREDFRGEGCSLKLRDHWDVRWLGPAVEGKLASNEFWYMYFVREGGEWRIWKLELAEH